MWKDTNQMDFHNKTDEELAALAQQGDGDATEYLMHKYAETVRITSTYYYLAGGDRDDLLQEGMIGLFRAVQSYRPNKNAGFRTFAELCIVRRMITAVKLSTRKKNAPLNHYIPIHGIDAEEREDVLFRHAADAYAVNPEDIVIDREQAGDTSKQIFSRLSAFEKQVLHLYLKGVPYREIAQKLSRTPKAVDNALSRIKKKASRQQSE